MDNAPHEGRYANAFNVGYNAFEIVLDFGQHYADRPDATHTRVITSPTYGKVLLATLRDALAAYERAFGAIRTTEHSYEDVGAREPAESARAAENEENSMAQHPDRPKPPSGRYPSPPGEYEPRAGGTPPDEPYARWQHGTDRSADSYRREPTEPPPDSPQYPSMPAARGSADASAEPAAPPAAQAPGDTEQQTETEDWPTPKDQLDKLKAELDRQEAELQALTKQRDTLKGDIAALDQTVTDFAKTVSDYKDASKSLEQQKRELDAYVATKTPMVDAAIRAKRGQIDACISGIDSWIADWRAYADNLKEQATTAADRADQATAAASAQQSTYDRLKATATTLDAELKAQKALRDATEQEDDQNRIENMYFLLKELRTALDQISIPTPAVLDHALSLAWTDLSDAKAASRDAAAAAEAAKNDAEAASKKAEDAASKRRQTILDCIGKAFGRATSSSS